jgi:DNA-binding FadR family transcriptional regulator
VARHLKVSEVVARQIVRDIAEQELSPSQLLDNESAMLEKYEVSRGSLREALRILESQGVITIKPGQGGGSVVAPRDPQFLGRMLALHFEVHAITYAELAAAIELLEPLMAAEAARRFTDIAEHRAEPHEGTDFHEWVYRLGGNGALTLLVGAISSIMDQHLRVNLDLDELAQGTRQAHDAIRGAIFDGDVEGARRAMAEHTGHTMTLVRQTHAELLGSIVRWL